MAVAANQVSTAAAAATTAPSHTDDSNLKPTPDSGKLVAESTSTASTASLISPMGSIATAAGADPLSTPSDTTQQPASSIPHTVTPILSQFWANLTEKATSTFSSISHSGTPASEAGGTASPTPAVVPSPAQTPALAAPSQPDITILGKVYSFTPTDSPTKEEVLADINSRIWLTYRTGFEPIPRAQDGPKPLAFIQSMIFNRNLASTFSNLHSLTDNENFTTDVGWGCMIRTSQSLLANALQTVLLGRDYNYTQNGEGSDDQSTEILSKLIDKFLDHTSAPFSLHNFIKVAGESPLQVKPGEWFGASAASLSIKRLCNNITSEDWNGSVPLQVLISESSDIYDDQILAHFAKPAPPLLILLPIRLGIENVSPYYYDSLFNLLTLKQSVGIAGGKPSSSYYFFGFQESKFLYLDPHYPQTSPFQSNDANNNNNNNNNNDKNNGSTQHTTNNSPVIDYTSYHTTRYSTLDISQMDPSMLVGFVIKDSEDYKGFTKSLLDSKNKIIHFHKQKDTSKERSTSISHQGNVDAYVQQDINSQDEDEDFVQIGEDTENGFIDLGEVEGEEVEGEEGVTVSRDESEILVEHIDEPVNIEREEGIEAKDEEFTKDL